MATLGPRLGYKQRLYFGVTLASSSFTSGTLITNVKEVKISDNRGPLENTTRACNGFKQFAQGLRDLGISFKMNVDDGDTNGFVAAFNAYKNGTTLKVAAVDANDVNGVIGEFVVAKFEGDEKNGEIVEIDAELRPYYAAAIPPSSV
jgi:hypothetical protein